MQELNDVATPEQQVETLETEIKRFADGLPYWAKFLAEKMLSGNAISDDDVNRSYGFLLEELKIQAETEKPGIKINYNSADVGDYRADLLFSKLDEVKGVNALVEKQAITFHPKLTIIYGENGSGKTGYIRLLKKAFYSKSREDILPNIHASSAPQDVSAIFGFSSKEHGHELLLYPDAQGMSAFRQYAVFDGKSVLKHLDQRNEFEFRPAGLGFFADFTIAIERVEALLNSEITSKQKGPSASDLAALFDGESEIKSFVETLSAQTKTADLNKYKPFTEEDKKKKEETEKKYDELRLNSQSKEKFIRQLENIKKLLGENKTAIERLNASCSTEFLGRVNENISDYLKKAAAAKAEGIEGFATDRIEGIGSEEWKEFIEAAHEFAQIQKEEKEYPEDGDNCLLCHQPLSVEAQKLITNYWKFIKSDAEEQARKSLETINGGIQYFQKLDFNLFPEENTLTVWLAENHPDYLGILRTQLARQATFVAGIIADLGTKTVRDRKGVVIDVTKHDTISQQLDAVIKSYKEDDEQNKELAALLKEKTFLVHKEKFNVHFEKFETFIAVQDWLKKANKAQFFKRKITDAEKALSEQYFNQKYVDAFNDECLRLNGNFGIEVDRVGAKGKSYRQLKLKGRNPNTILSEGEQKVIALADFLTEMRMSEINRGVIFDDPVTSLDDGRKGMIAARLSEEAEEKQVIIFTHDLIFVSNLIISCEERDMPYSCHWIENRDNQPGRVWLDNAPVFEKEYRNAEPAKKLYSEAKKDDCPPAQRETLIKQGFGKLRTCYEVLVINDLFKNVVQRYNERVSVDALKDVFFDDALIEELMDSYAQCCRYMEGHSHSDKYAYIKPQPKNLNEEIQRYEAIRTKIRKIKKA